MSIKNISTTNINAPEITNQNQPKQQVEKQQVENSAFQTSDPNISQRLSQQFARSRKSIGSLKQQQQIANLLEVKPKASPEHLQKQLKTISSAALYTDSVRQQQTEQSVAKSNKTILGGVDKEINAISRSINKAADALSGKDQTELGLINKTLDVFNQVTELLQQVIQIVKSQISPTPSTPSAPSRTVETDPAQARTRLSEMGLAGSTLRQITDSAALRLAALDDKLLQNLGQQNADNERAFARKIDGLPQDTFDKLISLGGSEQSRITKLSSQQIINEIKKLPTPEPVPTPTPEPVPTPTPEPVPTPTPEPVPTPTPEPVPTPGPTPDPALARTRLSEMGLAGSTLRQITDSAALRLAGLDDDLLKNLGRQNADNERTFARKIDGLPQDTFDKLKSLGGSEQQRITKLSSQQIIDEINKLTPPAPTPTPEPTPTPTPGPTPTPTPEPTPGPTPNPNPSGNVNIFLGNPSNAVTDVNNPGNYLMEKQQFTISYNRDKGIPNWVSWHLDSTNLGNSGRAGSFAADTSLPPGWYQVTPKDYSGSGYTRGHMIPSSDRTVNKTANSEVFLMTNMIPQTAANNSGPWNGFENYCRGLVNSGNELYIISGGYGSKGTIANGKVDIPERTWKIAVILPKGDNDLARIDANTRVIAIDMPNENSLDSKDWQSYRTSVDRIENATGYDFLSNVSSVIQTAVEARVDNL
ncbi:MAG: DNA/RNA non-specific endonuclease [Blastocatellia bacterium]|nr:DNA/RNA non-specific endonuclease [Blastocatellia bacterium]